MTESKIFSPSRILGCVSNHIPLQVRFIKTRKENLLITCIGNTFHTYSSSNFSLISVSGHHPDKITCMTADAYHVYTSCDKNVYAWRRGSEIKHVYRGHEKPIKIMIPFGIHLISVDEDGIVKVWNIKTENVFLELTFNNAIFKVTAILHPSSYINKILFGSDKGQLQLWNIKTAKLIHTFKGWNNCITCLEQAPVLDVVAVGHENGRIILLNLKYDQVVMEFSQDWGSVTAITFRSDGPHIMATGSTGGYIMFWDLDKHKLSHQLSAHVGPVSGMVCLVNEPLLVTSSPDNTLKLWIFDSTNGEARLLRIREGHSQSPTYIRYHGMNGHNILSAAGDSSLRIFNTQTERFNKSLGKASYNRKPKKKKGRTDDSLIIPPIIQFASDTNGGKMWDNIAAIHRGLSIVTTWSYDKVKMGNSKLIPDRLQTTDIDKNFEFVATCLTLSICGNFVLVGYSSGHVDRYNMQSGLWRNSYGNPKAHECCVRGVIIGGSNHVITAGSEGKLKFWIFGEKGGDPIKVIKFDESVSFLIAHQENALLATVLDDFSITLVDAEIQKTIRKFCGHTAQITDACFSNDGRWLITSSMDCTIRTWEILSGQLIDQFTTALACVSLCMSPTGETLATAHINSLGIFLWLNKTVYAKVTLKGSFTDSQSLDTIPKSSSEIFLGESDNNVYDEVYRSPEQIHRNLITLSEFSTSLWQNVLDIHEIKKRNKPANVKVTKFAPFFLPNTFRNSTEFNATSKVDDVLKISKTIPTANTTEFEKLFILTQSTNNFSSVFEKFESFGCSMFGSEIKSISSQSFTLLQFLKCLELMLKSNKNFELAEAYLSLFLKTYGLTIVEEKNLHMFLPNLRSCHCVAWHKLLEFLSYVLCILQFLKTR